MNNIEFLNSHSINWFPIFLKEKVPGHIWKYNATPKTSDFNTLTIKEIKKRQSLYKEEWVNSIAVDTRHIHHIDIDFENDNEIDPVMDTYIDSLPYYKSTTKTLGKHLFFIGNIDSPLSIIKDIYLNVKKIEILKGQWAYLPINTVIVNCDKSLNIDIYPLINMEALKDSTNKLKKIKQTIKENKSVIANISTSKSLDKDSYYYTLIDMIENKYIHEYDHWWKLCYAMKNIGMSDKEIHELSSKSEKYKEFTTDDLLKKHQNKVWTFGKQTIKYYAKLSNPSKYTELIIKKKDLKLISNDYQLAKSFIALCGDEIKYIDDKLYVYDKGEWMLDAKHQLIKPIAVNFLDRAVEQQLIKINEKKDEIGFDAYNKGVKELASIANYMYDYSRCCKVVKFIIDLLKQSSNDNTEIFDLGEEQKYNIHYKNGVFNIKDKSFRKRTKDDLITYKLNYNYIEIDTDNPVFEEVYSIFKKLQPNEDHRKFEIQWLAYCLTGDTSKQKFKCNIGYNASNGKSTLLSIHDRAFPQYTAKLDPKTFNKDYGKSHKQFATLLTKPVRLAYIEELDRDKLDPTLLKDFVDGKKLPVEILFSTTKDAIIQAKLNTNSNKDFNIEFDKGVLRRGCVQYFNSDFDEKNEEDDAINHKYKCDPHIELQFDSEIYKNAYRAVLMNNFDYSKFTIPEYSNNNFAVVLEGCDEFPDMLEDEFEITRDENNKVSIFSIVDCMKKFDKKYDKIYVINKLKAIGLKYNRSCRIEYNQKKSVRGVVFGLVKREPELLDESDDGDSLGVDSPKVYPPHTPEKISCVI